MKARAFKIRFLGEAPSRLVRFVQRRRRVGAGLIMSPTRNRNFVRRVPDKSKGSSRSHLPRWTRPRREGKEQGISSRERGKEEPVISARARSRGEITRCHTPFVARHSFRTRGSSEAEENRPRASPFNGETETREHVQTSNIFLLLRAIIIVRRWFALLRS